MISDELVSAFSDPGIIPRKIDREAKSPFRQPPMSQTVTIKGEKVQLKHCVTCNVSRHPRAVHCGVCDNCVDRFDHHW
jgi:palmitoyltransferase ZDHHC9/14/18